MFPDPLAFLAELLGIDPSDPSGIKPGHVAAKFESLAGQGLGLASQLPPGGLKDGLVEVLQRLNLGANAAARAFGGYTVEELSRGPALRASGSGLEAVEAQLRAEASDPGRYPAPAGPAGPGSGPPPARGDGEG